MNEFYAVELIDNESVIIEGDENFYFFRSKDNAFQFLWQQFLNNYANDYDADQLGEIETDMYTWYGIEDFGFVHTCGFED